MKKDAEDSIPKEAVLELIKEMGGCDAVDEFARGWDAACEALMEKFKGRNEKEKKRNA